MSEEEEAAWATMLATAAGRIARKGLVRLAISEPPSGADLGALREWIGERRFARRILSLVQNLDGPDHATDHGVTDAYRSARAAVADQRAAGTRDAGLAGRRRSRRGA